VYRTLRNIKTTYMEKEERFYIGLKDRKKIPVVSETLFTLTIGIRKPIKKGRRQLLQISLSEECGCTVSVFLFPASPSVLILSLFGQILAILHCSFHLRKQLASSASGCLMRSPLCLIPSL
jgi:hypothetical protein